MRGGNPRVGGLGRGEVYKHTESVQLFEQVSAFGGKWGETGRTGECVYLCGEVF